MVSRHLRAASVSLFLIALLPLRIGVVALQVVLHQLLCICGGRNFSSTSAAIKYSYPNRSSLSKTLLKINWWANKSKHANFVSTWDTKDEMANPQKTLLTTLLLLGSIATLVLLGRELAEAMREAALQLIPLLYWTSRRKSGRLWLETKLASLPRWQSRSPNR